MSLFDLIQGSGEVNIQTFTIIFVESDPGVTNKLDKKHHLLFQKFTPKVTIK